MAEFEKPEIIWTDSSVPKSRTFDDFYFNEDNGPEESRFVFLQHNQLQARWGNLAHCSSQHQIFTIAETGFGTGLNFLTTWALWNKVAPKTATLHYIAIEKYPLNREQIKKSNSQWTELSLLAEQLYKQYPSPLQSNVNRLTFNRGRIKLTLIFDDAKNGLAGLRPSHSCAQHVHQSGYHYGSSFSPVDAWFLDGFSPAKNPDMWTLALYEVMAALSQKNTSIATSTSASDVRRNLHIAGFNVKATPGFGPKREMLAGFFEPSEKSNARDTHEEKPQRENGRATRQRARQKETPNASWHLSPNQQQSNIKHIAIIGAGLAGAHCAYALASRGFKITVLEKNNIASGASGNPQGVVYTRFSHQQDALAQFNRYALHYADSLYSNGFYDRNGERCGVLHLGMEDKQQAIQLKVAEQLKENKPLASWLTKLYSAEATQLDNDSEGLFTEYGGWLQPPEVCQHLLQHSNITVKEHTAVHSLTPIEAGWELDLGSDDNLTADAVIIANANSATQFEQTAQLAIKPIRGQMTYGEIADNEAFPLATCLCGEGYIAPAIKRQDKAETVCFGATFDLGRHDLAVSDEDNLKNLALAAQLISPAPLPNLRNIQGRASYRCTTRDYLPIVGPVCNTEEMLETFAPYRANKYTIIDQPGQYHRNLFINIGHGSRGLSYTPLAAEILASVITGEPLPIDEQLYRQVHPARFIIRDLVRNKV